MSLSSFCSPEYRPLVITYTTGLEKYDEQGNLDIELSIQAIQDAMYDRNPEKYGDFIKKLNKQSLLLKIMGVPDRNKRLELFKYTYYAMRLLDDICDGDLVHKLSQEQVKNIVYNAVGENYKKGVHGLYEILIAKIQEISLKLGVDSEMNHCVDQIAKSLKFDFDRSVDTDKIRSKSDLEANFDMMDIIGTEYGTAVILGLNPEATLKKLTELGVACRIGYNIRDLLDDIHVGLINIPQEDLKRYNISQEDIDQVKQLWTPRTVHDIQTLESLKIPDSIILWLESEIRRMNTLVEEFKVKYSVKGILFGGQSIPALYKQNFFRERFNNLVMRILVLPSVYLSDINDSQGGKS